MISAIPTEQRPSGLCSLYPRDMQLPAEVEAQYVPAGGPRIRAAYDQFVSLYHHLDDPVPLHGTLSRSAVEHESRGGLYQSPYDAACAAIALDDAGCRVRYDTQYRPRGPQHLLALAVPRWRGIDPEIQASAVAVMRDDPGRNWIGVWRLAEQIDPTAMDALAAGLVARIGDASPASRTWLLPIAGTGRVDDVRWIFDRQAQWSDPDLLAELAGVETPASWTPPLYTPRRRRAVR